VDEDVIKFRWQFSGSRNQWKANKKEMKIGHGACCLAVKENERKEGLYILLSKPFYLLFKFCISIFKYYKIWHVSIQCSIQLNSKLTFAVSIIYLFRYNLSSCRLFLGRLNWFYNFSLLGKDTLFLNFKFCNILIWRWQKVLENMAL
jgi:hypothetical protein